MSRSTSLRFSAFLFVALGAAAVAACQSADASDDDEGSALTDAPPQPTIARILSGGQVIWEPGRPAPSLRPGQELTLEGSNFGGGPSQDLSKIVIGNSRALERDIPVYKGDLHVIREFTGGALYDESPEIIDSWQKDIRSWSDSQITFRVPATVNGKTALVVQVQKYAGAVQNPDGQPHRARDPLADYLKSNARERAANATVGVPGPPAASQPIAVTVDNTDFEASRKRGEAIFWAWDFNLGVAQKLADAGWDDIFSGRARDPVTGQTADPSQFGAIYIDDGVQVPDVARQAYAFQEFPISNPLETLLSSSLKSGTTKPIGWVGYVRAEGKDPRVPGVLAKGEWIGFNCVSCHARRIDFEAAPGQRVAKVFTGLPNHKWNPKWTTFNEGKLRGMKGREAPPASRGGKGDLAVDKTMLLYSMPDGATEATLIQAPDTGGFANDFLFSPVAIPNITRHTPLRRALSRPEQIAGFEGSYLHPQAPEGTMGPMHVGALRDLTTYMTTLDEDHEQLVAIGMYEWLKHKNRLGEVRNASQGEVVQMGVPKALQTYGDLKAKVDRGRAVFERDCQSCHADNFGTYTDERIFSFNEVGTYFSPSLWNRDAGGLRTAMLRELYWVQGRGMLHDGHVRSEDPDRVDSVEMLLSPDRCNPSSELYERLYTINARSFRVPKGNAEQEHATRMQAYFVDFPRPGAATGDENAFLYWDYQAMRSGFGPKEFGTAVKELPQAPHPWCARSGGELDELLHYLFTL
jgi:hypothetical protein